MKKTQWSSYKNRSVARFNHDEPPTRIHLTENETQSLCGRAIPAEKGNPAPGVRYCKRCLRAAYASGCPAGFTKELEWV